MAARLAGKKQTPVLEGNSVGLSNEIFSLLEKHFLFGFNDQMEVRGKVRVLSIDGGEIHGAMLALKTLVKIEEALQRNSSDSNATIADYFDIAIGTGVGGIIAAMLFADDGNGRPLYRAYDTWRLFSEKKLLQHMFANSSSSRSVVSKVFGNGNSGRARKLESVLRSLFTDANGKTLTLKDTVKPLLIPCYDLSTGAPFLFSRADALETDNFDFRLFEICRATSASPALFKPVVVRSINSRTACTAIDGGVVMSNPAAAAITHVLHNKHEFPLVNGVGDLLVLSVGAGLADRSFEYRHVRNWDVARWTKPLLELVGESLSDTVDNCLSLAFAQNPQHYVRIQGFGVPSEVADVSTESVRKAMEWAKRVMSQKGMETVAFGAQRKVEESNADLIEGFAERVVAEQRSRASRVVANVVVKQVTPRTSVSVSGPCIM